MKGGKRDEQGVVAINYKVISNHGFPQAWKTLFAPANDYDCGELH